MKRLTLILISALLLVSLTACTSVANSRVRANYKLIDHKGVLAGAKIPKIITEALTEPAQEIARNNFPDSYVFVTNQKGRSLDGVTTWAKNFDVQSQVSKQIQTFVNIESSSTVSGDKDLIETTMKVVTDIVSKTSISGLQMQQDWWLKLEYEDGKQEYHYVAIYTIKKNLLDSFMQRAIDRAIAQESLAAADQPKVQEFADSLKEKAFGLEEGTPEFTPDVFAETSN